MAIQLSPLPYEYKDLEPHLSEETLLFHYGKHHAEYVDNLNSLIRNTFYDKLLLEEIIFESAQNPGDKKIFNNAAQAWNHTFYWNCLSAKANPEPSRDLLVLIEKHFGKFKSFQDQFTTACQDLFGSGWVWLVKDSDEKLSIMPLENAENPIVFGKTPLLVCDVWEHSYYLDHQNKRSEYLKCFTKIINWNFVEHNLQKSPSIFHISEPQNISNIYH